jgi:hypothetical protein
MSLPDPGLPIRLATDMPGRVLDTLAGELAVLNVTRSSNNSGGNSTPYHIPNAPNAVLPPGSSLFAPPVMPHSTERNQFAPTALSPPCDGQNTWPPAFFSKDDVAFLAYHKVRAAVYGICPSNPGNYVYNDPPIDSRSTPVELRIALARLALTFTHGTEDYNLYLAPIGYLTNTQRQAWFRATGAQSKLFGTLDMFLSYATDAFRHHGKKAVVGLLNHVSKPSSEMPLLPDSATDDAATAEEIWKTTPGLARYAVILLLRLLAPGSADGAIKPQLQLIWYDPSHTDDGAVNARFAPSPVQHSRRPWVMEAWTAVPAWSVREGFVIRNMWYGGDGLLMGQHAELVGSGDPVMWCYCFLEHLVRGGSGVEGYLPGTGHKESWTARGYLFHDK